MLFNIGVLKEVKLVFVLLLVASVCVREREREREREKREREREGGGGECIHHNIYSRNIFVYLAKDPTE